jgi:hypothetical protein
LEKEGKRNEVTHTSESACVLRILKKIWSLKTSKKQTEKTVRHGLENNG